MIRAAVPAFLPLELENPEVLLLLLLALPILVVYLVNPPRRRCHDPFFFLWKALVRPRPWLGRLGRLVEVLLVLSAMAMLVLALANPGREQPVPAPRFCIVALNHCGSGAPLPEAARRLLRDLGPGDRGCVVAGGPEGARVLWPPTRGPVSPLQPGSTKGPAGCPDPRALLAMVRALARGSRAEVHWFGPPGFPGRELLPEHWTVHPVETSGGSREVLLTLRSRAAGGLSARIQTTGATSWRGVLRLEAGGEASVVATVEVMPGATKTVPVPRVPERSGKGRIILEEEGSGKSVQEAGFFRPRPRPLRIGVLARDGNAYPMAVLLGVLGDRVDQKRSGVLELGAGLAYLEGVEGEVPPFDFLVCQDPPDRPLPVSLPVLFFGGAGSLGTPAGGPREAGGVATWDRGHPLLEGVDLSSVAAEAVVRITPAEGIQVLARGPAGPMMLFRPGPTPQVAFPFPLEKSTFFREWGFTRLISNLVRLWGGEQPVLGPCVVGDPFPLAAGQEGVRAGREDDADAVWIGRAGDGFSFRPRRCGLFEAAGEGRRRACYFNPAVPDPGPEESPGDPDRGTGNEANGPDRKVEARGWDSYLLVLVWCALGILLVEWFLFHRDLF